MSESESLRISRQLWPAELTGLFLTQHNPNGCKTYPKLENTFKVLGGNLMDSFGIFILLVECHAYGMKQRYMK